MSGAGPLALRGLQDAARCEGWRRLLDDGRGVSRALAALPIDPAEMLQAVAASAAAPLLEAALGPAPWCNLAQSWLRHGRPPHGWHQDGALRFDFIAHAGRPAPADALLDLRTLWIALTPCGHDAPSLQWVQAATPTLLQPADLTPEAVAARFGEAAFVHAELASGDALLFDGTLLHRTYTPPQATRPRTSLELRFFRAGTLPARIEGDAGLRLHGSGGQLGRP